MKTYTALVIALLTTSAFSASAYAAEQNTHSPASSQDQRTANTDFGKLSVQGAKAYRDIQLTRLAIFNAKPDDAKRLIADAKLAFGVAKTDDTVFTKAESELHAPKGAAPLPHADTMPVAWVPVDGQMIMDENFVASPTASTAMADANKSLKKGDRKGAKDRLKLAGIDVDYIMAVMPMGATDKDVNKAATLINDGKYYEANIALLHAENGVRFDVADTRIPSSIAKVAGK